MAIKNNRKSIVSEGVTPSEDRLKNKLMENAARFMTEAPGEDDMDLGDDDVADLDTDMGGEGGPDMDADLGADDMGDDLSDAPVENPLDDLTDDEFQQVDAWVDELLRDSIDQVEDGGDNELDIESSASSLDPMGDEQYVHDDLPMSTGDLENVIDSDDSLEALQSALAALAQEDEEGGEGLGMEDEGMEGETSMGADLETEDDDNLFEEGFDFEQAKVDSDHEDELEEAEDPFKGMDGLGFDQGYEGEDVKDELMEEDELEEDVELAAGNKKIGYGQVAKGLNDTTPASVSGEKATNDQIAKAKNNATSVKEGLKKSKMITAAAEIILESTKQNENLKKEVAALKLENLKLMKVNGLLSAAADKLTVGARIKIAEGFDRCQNTDQINKFYAKVTESLKAANRPSLNEAVNGKKTKINVIKESKNMEQEVDNAQARKNYLMGLPTENDMYFGS